MARKQKQKKLLHTRNSTTETKKRKDISCSILETVELIHPSNCFSCVLLKYAPQTLGLENSSCESDEYTDFDVFRTPPNNARHEVHIGLSYIV